MPRVKQSLINTADVQALSRAAPPELDEAGFDPSDIQVVTPDRMETKAKVAKFMNELIEIEIEPGTEPNDPVFVHLGHQGIAQYVQRGVPQIVKRKFLYSALMGKRVTLNVSFGMGVDGKEFNREAKSVSTAYRARLISDPNPQGGPKWVQAVMAESAGMH